MEHAKLSKKKKSLLCLRHFNFSLKCKLHPLNFTKIYFSLFTLLSFNLVHNFQIYSIQSFCTISLKICH